MTAKRIPKLKILQCPYCLAMLEFDKDLWAYKCPNITCQAEVYRDPLDNAEPSIKQGQGNEYICRSMVGTVAPGGSSSGKKYGGKEKMKKKTPHQMYEKLCEK